MSDDRNRMDTITCFTAGKPGWTLALWQVKFRSYQDRKAILQVVATTMANAYLAAMVLALQADLMSYEEVIIAFDNGEYSCHKIRDIC